MKTKLIILAAAILSWALVGCQSVSKLNINSRDVAGWVLVPSPNDLIKVGQLVDQGFGAVEPIPSSKWLSERGIQAQSIVVNTSDESQLRAFLDLVGVDLDKVSKENFILAADLLRKESISLQFSDPVLTQLDVQMMNRFPRAAYIREHYTQLEDAFIPGGPVRLVATTLSASKFVLKTSVRNDSAAKLNELLDVSVEWKSTITHTVEAAKEKPVVVAVRFISDAVRLVPAGLKSTDTKIEQYSLSELIPNGTVSFRLTNHGLHNGGPYHTSAVTEIFESKAGDHIDLMLRCKGEIVNRGTGSPAEKTVSITLKSYPAHWVMKIQPENAKEFRREEEPAGNFAGAKYHGEFSSLVSSVEIVNPNDGESKFVFKPVKIVLQRD